MSDRELLELAAKAAGYTLVSYHEETSTRCAMFCAHLPVVGEEKEYPELWVEDFWNPLASDYDALRLAVKLKMVLDTDYNGGSIAGNSKVECNYHEPEFGYQEGNGEKDPYAATRRAIVRAAAEIGRRMQ